MKVRVACALTEQGREYKKVSGGSVESWQVNIFEVPLNPGQEQTVSLPCPYCDEMVTLKMMPPRKKTARDLSDTFAVLSTVLIFDILLGLYGYTNGKSNLVIIAGVVLAILLFSLVYSLTSLTPYRLEITITWSKRVTQPAEGTFRGSAHTYLASIGMALTQENSHYLADWVSDNNRMPTSYEWTRLPTQDDASQ